MREVEMKFRVSPPFQLPDVVGDKTGVVAVTKGAVKELCAVYWDTSDLRLAREGITLRHRSGEGDSDGWHLKLPVHEAGVPDAGIGARDEIHETGPDDSVPAALRDLVEVFLRAAVLGPVATLQTIRTSYQLLDGTGQPLAELVDDLVSVINQGHVAGRFREIEVEDAGGGMGVLEDVGTVLRTAGAVGGEFVPKVVRALGPRATADPDPPKPSAVDPKDPARLAVQAILRRYIRAFMANDQAVRRGADDGVHQMRVAARRLRSALKTFRPLVDTDWAQSLRDELSWVADSLGGARDAEVLLARLLGDLDSLPPEHVIGPVRARIEQTVGGDLATATETALATLRSERYLALIDRLVAAGWDPMTKPLAEKPTSEVLPALVADAWDRLAKGAAHVRRKDATDDDWHQTRIRAKQARYSAEAVVPVFGKPAKTLARQAEAVQELLGEHQDAVVAADVLRRLAVAPRSGSIAFTLGLLYARQLQVLARTRDEFPALWSGANDSRHRKWLRT
ncbi:MAG TPA: CYTH and CHAD domain-containing protein [Mycobacteriales bacterium]|nr:CYTH and CHAD domain-containing protein [Mycobacteriales bacterium]